MPQLLKGSGPCLDGVHACARPRRVSADAHLFSKENHEKIAFSVNCSPLCFPKGLDEGSVTRQVIVSRGRSSFSFFSLGQVLRTPAVPSRSSPLPSGGKNALWISLPARDSPPKPAPRHLHRVCGLGPRLTPFLASPALPSLQSRTKIPPLFCRKRLYCVPGRKGVNKPCVLKDPTLPPEMRDVSSASLPHRSSHLLAALCQHPQKVQAPPRLRMPRVSCCWEQSSQE